MLDLLTHPDSLGLVLEELRVGPSSVLVGKTLGEADVRGRYGVTVVAVKRGPKDAVLHPAPTERVGAGDLIVAMGQEPSLRRLQEACAESGT